MVERRRLRASLPLLALLLHAGSSRGQTAEAVVPAVEQQPRTTDELVQLYALSAGHGALATWWSAEIMQRPLTAWSSALAGVGTTAALAGTVAWLDDSQSLQLGQPQAIVTDSLVGLEISAAWVWHDTASRASQQRWSRAVQASLVWSGAVVGAAIGVVRYELSPSSPAEAAFTGSTALWAGALAGLVTAAATPSAAARDDNGTLALAVGLEAGVVSAAFLRRIVKPQSMAWIRWLDAGALTGAALGAGALLSVTGGELDSRATLAGAAGGITLGIVAATLSAPYVLTAGTRSANWAVVPSLACSADGVALNLQFTR